MMTLVHLYSVIPTTSFKKKLTTSAAMATPTLHDPSILKVMTTTSSAPLLVRLPDYKTNTPSSAPVNQIQSCNNNTVLDALRLMDALSLAISPDTYASLVDECTRKRDAVQAAELYDHMKRNDGVVTFLNGSSGLCLLNRVLLMLVTCGCFDGARHLFDEMPHRNCISLAIVMAGLVDSQRFEQALGLFVKMHRWFVYQECDTGLQVLVVSFLKACVHQKMVGLGKMVHGWLLKMGYERGLFLVTALVEFYGKSGCLWEANHVFFDHIRRVDRCDTVLWTGVIVNNCREQHFEEVIRIFHEMGVAGVKMNEFTFSNVIKACGRVGGDGSFGQQVHANAVKLGFNSHVFVMCALIDMYGRCRLLKDAKKVFDMMDHRKRNSACWNAMVTGFIQHELYIEALRMMYQMKEAGLQPQKSMIDEVRLACGSLKLEM